MKPTIKSCIAISAHEWVLVPGEYYPKCALCNNTWLSEYGTPPDVSTTQIGGFKAPPILYQYLTFIKREGL